MTRSLLAGGPFRAFLVANCAERFAASALTVLLGYQIYEITHDALAIGWLGLIEAVPGVTLVLYGGHVADRHSRRGIVVAATAALAALALLLALLSTTGAAGLRDVLYALAFLAGVVRAFEGPAASGLEAQIVPIAQLMRGLGLLATTARLADVLGPIAGGVAWSALGPGWTYGLIAALFALACVAILAGVPEHGAPARTAAQADDEPPWHSIIEGVRYVFADAVLCGSMALDLFAVFFGGAAALLPIFATDILHVGPVGFGFLRAASGAGALVAALLVARTLPQRHAGVALHAVIAGFGVAIIIFGLSRSLPLSLAALFVTGLCDGTSVVIRRAILRIASPDAMRGRIAAVKSVFVGSSNELGAFESGVLAHAIGAQAAVWSGGLVTLAVVAATACLAPRLRRLDLAQLAAADHDARPVEPAAAD